MLNLVAFWWMVVMAILKLTGVVVCSWWLVFGPMIAMIFATIIFLSYVHMLPGGIGKFLNKENNMGYYTRYNLKTVGSANAPTEEINKRLNEISRYTIEMDETTNGIKWYDHEKNMKQLSAEYPDILFKLTGEGEESEDIWESYYKNGKSQYCEAVISFEPYDESKLK